MKTFTITEEIYYSGRETIEYTVDANNESEAEKIAEEKCIGDLVSFWSADFNSEGMTISEPKEPRCTETKDMFDG